MLFTSIKEINRLRKELNGLLSKEMSNIYLKITTETFSNFYFLGLKLFFKICVLSQFTVYWVHFQNILQDIKKHYFINFRGFFFKIHGKPSMCSNFCIVAFTSNLHLAEGYICELFNFKYFFFCIFCGKMKLILYIFL